MTGNMNISESNVRDQLYEWCHRLHLPDAIAAQCLHSYTHDSLENRRKLKLRFNNRKLALCAAAFYLYKTCRESECLVTICDIIRVTGCERKLLWRSVKLDRAISIDILKPRLLIQRYLVGLNLTQSEKSNALAMCSKFSCYIGHSPKTILAYCIYSSMNSNDSDGAGAKLPKRLYQLGSEAATVKNLCQHVGISPTCLFRFKRLVSENPN